MRHVRIALALASLTLAASGCFEDVMTLQPLHTERTVVDEPRLVGTWKFGDPSGLDWDVSCKVSETTDHGYRIVVDANGEKHSYIGYVVRLGKLQIIDLTEDRPANHAATAGAPRHWFARLDRQDEQLTIYPTSSHAFRRAVQAHPLASHTKEERLIVTASTPELQAFFTEKGAAAFRKDEKIVLRKCTPGEVLKPTFAGFDPFATPWGLFSSALKVPSTDRLKMPPLTGARFARLNQLVKAFVRTGHEVRFARGSTAPSADKVYSIESQEPSPGKPLRPDAGIVLTLYTKDAADPLPPVPHWLQLRNE